MITEHSMTIGLIGRDNALLYQVWLTKAALNYYEGVILRNPYGRCTGGPYKWDCGYQSDRLLQSQLTTITKVMDPITGENVIHRTRTAQGFDAFASVGSTTYASYYREKKVSEDEFWTKFNSTLIEFNIEDSDICGWKSSDSGKAVPTGLSPGIESCALHLEESFNL